MSKNLDTQEPELITAFSDESGRAALHPCNDSPTQPAVDIIDVTELCPEAEVLQETKRSASGGSRPRASENGISEGAEQCAEVELVDDDFDDQVHEGELVSDDAFDENFAQFDEGQDDVIDLGGNLPAISETRLPSIAVRDNLQSYLKEVSRFPLLDPEEETQLARRVRDHGDSEAAFRIISSHLRLVVRIAMDFQRRWMQNVLDLIQEGNVGLLRAVNKFDPDKGIKFSYYASFWIKAYILKFIMDNWRMVKIGTTQAQRKLFYNLNRERQKLILQGFDPDAALLSQRLGVTQDQVLEMQQRLDAGDVSLDVPVSDENGSASRMDFLPALGPGVEDDIAGAEVARLVRSSIEELLPSLSEKEIYILENRLLTDEPATLREIGERYNVTRERIRQLEARLLEKLKAHLGQGIRDCSEDWINQ
ncbi:MAG: RNA polymerase factor sigma-32 [Mailhella sp.]|nr:RNA polymerase factor sigma-32 [Mailhella sp.]